MNRMSDVFTDQGLPGLDSCIHSLESQLADLKEQRNLITSPLCRAPIEVLQEILLRARVAPPERSAIHQPISRRVRAVVLGTPAMWSVLSFGKPNMQYSAVWTDLCLERGQGHPVTLRMTLPYSKDRKRVSFTHDSLVPTTRALTLQGSDWDQIGDRFLSHSWPSLDHLELIMDKIWSSRLTVASSLLGGASDTLTRLSISAASTNSDRGAYAITGFPSLPNLLHLELLEIGVVDCFDHVERLLRSTSQLLTLRLRESNDCTTILPNTQRVPLCLPNLTSLSLTSPNIQTLPVVLKLFPDPHEELQVIFARSREPHRVRASAHPSSSLSLLYNAIRCVQPARPISSHLPSSPAVLPHKVVFHTPHEERAKDWTGFVITPVSRDDMPPRPSSAPSSASPIQSPDIGARRLTLDMVCELYMLPFIIAHASAIEVIYYAHLEEIFQAALKCPCPDKVTRLTLHSPPDPARWQTAASEDEVQGFLRERKRLGCPLTTLTYKGSCYKYSHSPRTRRSWLQDGLVKEIYEEGRLWDPATSDASY